MSDDAAREILVVGARALAHDDPATSALGLLLSSIARGLDVESAAIVVAGETREPLEIAASTGLPEGAIAGLTSAMRNPGHPIARTFVTPVATFDVLPTAPGGPALRTHVPLVVTRGGAEIVLGVLALAHAHPIDADRRPLLQASADLAAVAIERGRTA